ncbi:MAG: DUF3298 and DUF4163 domain-containing protein [Lachnospiraceae bacterium]|nr:DUF3298 and DUF4163 domain-containing protein [Lachnospiraceae bacterium]
MKKITALLILFVVTAGFSGCRKAEVAVNEPSQAEEAAETPAPEEPKEGETPKESETKEETPLTVLVHSVVCKGDDGKELATGTYPEILLSEDKKSSYPKLADSLSKKNEEWADSVRTSTGTYGYYCMTDDMGLGPYSSEIKAEPDRFDDRLFSLQINYYDFAGGAHPNHGTEFLNLDPVTGRKLSLADVITDPEGAPKLIKDKVYAAYPDLVEEIESYAYLGEEGENEDIFTRKFEEDTYTWSVNDEGLYICFSPYEIATYAAGYIDITLGYDEYPGLIVKAYAVSDKIDKKALSEVTDADTEEVSPEDSGDAEDAGPVTLSNPGWESFYDEVYEYQGAKHISLTKLTEEKSDWLDTDRWAEENGFVPRRLPYADDMYYYEPASPVEYDYMYNELKIYDKDKENLLYDFDMYTLINGPDEKAGKTSRLTQYIKWAQIYKDILYVSVGHNTYSSSEPDTSYMIAINLGLSTVIWRSSPLVSNARNFKIVGDTIICGYGFTAEDDFIYLLDVFTGKTVDKIKVNSGPDQFEVVGDKLYVATYNTAYTFKIEGI